MDRGAQLATCDPAERSDRHRRRDLLGAAILSLAGIALFLGNWPAFNTVAAIVANIVILLAAL